MKQVNVLAQSDYAVNGYRQKISDLQLSGRVPGVRKVPQVTC